MLQNTKRTAIERLIGKIANRSMDIDDLIPYEDFQEVEREIALARRDIRGMREELALLKG